MRGTEKTEPRESCKNEHVKPFHLIPGSVSVQTKSTVSTTSQAENPHNSAGNKAPTIMDSPINRNLDNPLSYASVAASSRHVNDSEILHFDSYDLSQPSFMHSTLPQKMKLTSNDTSSLHETTNHDHCPTTSSDMSSMGVELGQFPCYNPVSPPNFTWGSLSGTEFQLQVNHAYSEVVHWKQNLFRVPSGTAGNKFVSELTRLFQAFADSSSLESIALTASMLMPQLLLQRPYKHANKEAIQSCLSRRLNAWFDGNISDLLREGNTIQKQLTSHTQRFKHIAGHSGADTEKVSALKFANLVKNGNIKAADRLINKQGASGVLSLTKSISDNDPTTVRDVLKEKHPQASPLHQEALLDSADQIPVPHSILFDQLDGSLIRSMALKSSGAAGPSGLDASNWKRLCTSFKSYSNELCTALAAVAKRLSTTFVDPNAITALVACRLIPLDKNPGIRPIGICEVIRRILGKAILKIVRSNVLAVTGALQLCAGQSSGCEAAVHAMQSIYHDSDTEAILLVDATNAFNCLNRQVALKNISINCPSIFPILVNTYRKPSCLFVGGEMLWSQEGTTQGDPLAMVMYALATVPLITKLKLSENRQVWYADDAAAGGKLEKVRDWWHLLCDKGPKYGYFPNGKKSWLIVKPDAIDKARQLFNNTSVNITSEGHKYLGSAIGTETFRKTFLQQKIIEWTNEIADLARIARSQPHAAYAAFTHGIVGRWTYALRTNRDDGTLLCSLESAIQENLIPALLNRAQLNPTERQLIALPARFGGLGIINPENLAYEYSHSQTITAPLVKKILQQDFALEDTSHLQEKLKLTTRQHKQQQLMSSAATVENQLPQHLKRAILLSKEKGASSWLTVIPVEEHGYYLHKSAFRDSICLRYGWKPAYLPDKCPCGGSFNVDHALTCPTGGFPSLRHNEIRDIVGGLLGKVCNDVKLEPVLQSLNGESFVGRSTTTDNEARLDIRANGFWGKTFQTTFFDVRIFNANAPSYRDIAINSCYKRQEQEKKRKYEHRIQQVELSSFTPIVYSCTGGCSSLTNTFVKRLASLLANKTGTTYNLTINWLRCRIGFALLRSSIMCLRGSRSKPPCHELGQDLNISLATAESGMVS